jgi:membrane-associated phospholipid phosphatase
MNMSDSKAILSRRSLLGGVAGVFGAALATAVPATAASAVSATQRASKTRKRGTRAFDVRYRAAIVQRDRPIAPVTTNGDENRYPERFASYTKGLRHDQLGHVAPNDYRQFIKAVESADKKLFDNVMVGGVLKQANPLGAWAFSLDGIDSHDTRIAAPPPFSSAEQAAEMVELYWHSLTRDIPFDAYDSHPLIQQAASDLSRLADFTGLTVDGRVTTGTIFRGATPGALRGPYVSQFLLFDIPAGALHVEQRIRTAVAGKDYLTEYGPWLEIQNGVGPRTTVAIDAVPRYIRNARDLCEFVRHDYPFQAFVHAALILLAAGATRNKANPYRLSKTQAGFCTFGAPHILDAVAHVASLALKASWFQKWLVHRRVRPEAFGGCIHNQLSGRYRYSIHEQLFNSAAMAEVHRRQGTYLLAQAYPEGCPAHPSYPAGHAAIAGACATVLKLFFDERFPIWDAREAAPDGLSLRGYSGPALTVGGEIEKLAFNIALSRDAAGVHYRSDSDAGLRLGETVALQYLAESKACFAEALEAITVTTFDGQTVSA